LMMGQAHQDCKWKSMAILNSTHLKLNCATILTWVSFWLESPSNHHAAWAPGPPLSVHAWVLITMDSNTKITQSHSQTILAEWKVWPCETRSHIYTMCYTHRFPHSDHSMQLDHIRVFELSHDGSFLQKLDFICFIRSNTSSSEMSFFLGEIFSFHLYLSPGPDVKTGLSRSLLFAQRAWNFLTVHWKVEVKVPYSLTHSFSAI